MTMRQYPFGMFEEMERLFESMRQSAMDLQRYGSALGLEETDDGYVVLADLPGFEKDEISLTVNGGVLTVRADHEISGEDGSRTRRVHESMRLPGDVDVEAITATYRNGVLEVTLPGDEGRGSTGHRIDVE